MKKQDIGQDMVKEEKVKLPERTTQCQRTHNKRSLKKGKQFWVIDYKTIRRLSKMMDLQAQTGIVQLRDSHNVLRKP